MNVNMKSLMAYVQHVRSVQLYMQEMVELLMVNMLYHDASKVLNEGEHVLLQHKYLLDSLEYGSNEYTKLVEELHPHIVEHWYNNSHHIEFHDSANDMTLFDWLEWLADLKSFETDKVPMSTLLENQVKKYQLEDNTAQMLYRTCNELGWI